jgi:GNAT superfamily N-acetyltransferase
VKRPSSAVIRQVRAMQPDERPIVTQLFHDVWHETQAKLQDQRKAAIRGYDFFKSRVDMPSVQTLVAVEDASIIGFVRWEPGHLHSLFVAQDQRGKRVGEKLCEAIIIANASDGGGPLQLDCVVGNWAARHFYEHHGWRLKETTDHVDETPDGQIIVKHWVMLRP